MLLVGIEGLPNSGKTLLAIRYVKQDYDNGKRIISNTPLIGIEYEDFDINKFLSNDNDYRNTLNNSTILLDELTMYMDCRLPMKKHGLLLGYMVLQKRKRNVDIYYTVQDLDLIDYKRCVKYTDIIVYCQEIYVNNAEGKKVSLDNHRNYSIIDMRKNSDNVSQFVMDIRPYFKYYDTNYIIEPIIDNEKSMKNVIRKTK